MAFNPLSLATASIVVLATASQAAAGGKAVECYQRYSTAPVYDTVYEQVMVRAGSSRVEVTPAVYGTEKRRVVISPERVQYRHIPAEYGYVKEKVLIRAASTYARVIPAVTRTVYSEVKVSDGGYSWEYRMINGRKVLCKIKNKPRYKTVAQTVVVQPERVVHETVPAEYGYQSRKVVISEGYKEKYVVPAEYGTVQEKVLIEPARKRLVETPAVYETVARKVLVSEGRTGWERVAIPRHCR